MTINGGATLFVAVIGGLSAVSGPSADTGSNSWTGLTARVGAASGNMQMFYVTSPAGVSSSHTFTNANSSFAVMHVLGFSGTGAFDKESGQDSQALSEQPGSLTPTTDGTSLFVTGMGGGTSDNTAPGVSIDSGFTLDHFTALVGGVNYSCGSAYFIQVATGAKNPTWTSAIGTDGVAMAVFAPAGAAATPFLTTLGARFPRR